MRRGGAVVARPGDIAGIVRRGHALKRLGDLRPGRRAKRQRLIIEKRQLLGRRTGLAEIAAVVAHRVLEHAPANALRHRFRRLHVLHVRPSASGTGNVSGTIHLTEYTDN
jgi:hypothetical protein